MNNTNTNAPHAANHDIHVTVGNRTVIICKYDGWSRNDVGGGVWYSARLYVNGTDSATLLKWKGKTEKGARRWAARVLSA